MDRQGISAEPCGNRTLTTPTMDCKIKAPPSAGRMWLVGLEIFGVWHIAPAGAFARNAKRFQPPNRHPSGRRRPIRHDLTGR